MSCRNTFGAEIILLSSDGVGTVEIIQQTGKSNPLWRW